MNRKRHTRRKVLWAFDPFEATGETQIQVAEVLSDLTSRLKISIQPVYVLSLAAFNIPLAFNSEWLKEYLPSAEKAMIAALKDIPLAGMSRPKVIVQRAPSLKQSVKAVLGYAKAEGADLIVAGTHSKRGLQRFFLGSFAETLLLQARIPVLTVNPTGSSAPIQHILFPTDFGVHSKSVFKRLALSAKEMGAKITVLHVSPHPLAPVVQSGVFLLGGGWVPLEEYRRASLEQYELSGAKWVAEAKKLGVPVDLVLDDQAMSVSSGITGQAVSLKTNLIAMAADSGPLVSALIGSNVRQVVREAPCPVWVLRPRA